MNFPDLRGYELENHIHTTVPRLVIIWFGKIEREAERWRQVQVTLIGARLNMADVEIVHGFPPLRSVDVSEMNTAGGKRIQIQLCFDGGEIAFECENFTYSEFSHKIQVL
jgi:hypothetical protein